ncbi:UNVERIFIED_CONTAM: hypothetical protein FKN15_010965 [Acipenser sinensis]
MPKKKPQTTMESLSIASNNGVVSEEEGRDSGSDRAHACIKNEVLELKSGVPELESEVPELESVTIKEEVVEDMVCNGEEEGTEVDSLEVVCMKDERFAEDRSDSNEDDRSSTASRADLCKDRVDSIEAANLNTQRGTSTENAKCGGQDALKKTLQPRLQTEEKDEARVKNRRECKEREQSTRVQRRLRVKIRAPGGGGGGGERAYECAECQQSFETRRTFNLHKKSTHQAEFICSECGETFGKIGALQKHQRIHAAEKPYPCPECGKNFRHSRALKRHGEIHRRVRRYPCNDCSKSFSRPDSLETHKLVHSGTTKQHRCPECAKGFSDPGNLRRHQRIHTEDKPHRCSESGADLRRVVVTWERPPADHVVHSFYYGQDQLDLQNEAYRNRTQLFPEQLSVGNASLRLKQVREEDEGWYTCTVTNQVESTMGDVQLIVAVCDAVTVPRSPVTSPPGSDVTLHCSFSYKAGADLGKVVVTWQRPDYRVVHSFYYGQDQLALQNETYRNRTQLFPEQLSVGNASLRLKQVRGEDEGWYTCSVTNQVESTMGDVQLIVAAEFSEPQLVVTDRPDSPDKALLSCISTGYPSASVQWLNETGCDITESSRTSQSRDRDGLVEITSHILVSRDANYTCVLTHSRLKQTLKKTITLTKKVCDAVTVPRSPVTSPPGSDVTLYCSFSYKAGADLGRVVVTWERPPDYWVVHDYYYGQDQLALQNETYRNRTQLFPEQLSVGNASLRLKQVREEDEGWYTCAVNNQGELTSGDVRLIVAGELRFHLIVLQRTPPSRRPVSSEGHLQGWPLSPGGRSLADPRSGVPGCGRGSWLDRGIGGRSLNLQFS